MQKGRWDRAAQALPNVMDMSPGPTEVLFDDECDGRTSNTLLVTVSNSPRAGAGLALAPSAHMDDGLLDVCIYEGLNQAGVLARFLPSPVGGTASAADDNVVRARARTVEIRTAQPMPVSIESKLVGVTPARFGVLTGALSVIAGDGPALLHPASTELVRASASAAHTLAPAPQEADSSGTRRQLVKLSSAGVLQALVPAAGRALDTVNAARPIALPLLAGAIGVAAASVLRPRKKRFF
jgi:hypothetical protein